MKNHLFLLLLVSCLSCSPRSAESGEVELPDVRGWNYIGEKLLKDGFSVEEIALVYGDSRMPEFENVPFSVAPRESSLIYRGFIEQRNIKIGKEFLAKYSRALHGAEHTYLVSRHLIASILLIESRYGQNTGKELVLNRLSRVGAVRSPGNIEWNYNRLREEGKDVSLEEVEARAKYLEDTFYPEIRALFILARDRKLNPLELRGSVAGAIGIPQFLPSNYITFGVDGNANGQVSLFEMEDAIWSVARFFNSYGWRDDLPIEEKRSIIWKYNKSDAYIDAILKVAALLRLSETKQKKSGNVRVAAKNDRQT